MHPSLSLLREAEELARQELDLLDSEDAEGLTESVNRRSELIHLAWEGKSGCDESEFLSRIKGIQDLQKKLVSKAEEVFMDTRTALNDQRRSRKAVVGYAKIGIGYGKKPARIVTKFS